MKKTVLAAGATAGLLYLILLFVAHIVPFGDQTWVMFDLKRQYIDFFSYYQRIFAGQEGILYSFETALGSGMIGFFVYYLNNPLFLLLLFFRPDRLPLAVSFVIGVTLVLGAMIMAAFLIWYVKRREPHAQGSALYLTALFGALAWAFSGFLIAHSMNLMWTDVVIFVPVVIYALETAFFEEHELTEKERCLRGIRYTVCIALILLWNYYISWQVLLYVAIRALIRLFETKREKPLRTVLSLVAHTITAVLLDAVVLLPTLLELGNSPKDIFQLGLETTGKNITPVDLFSKAYFLAYDYIQPRFGLPQIYCGLCMLLPVLMFFIDRRRGIREKLAALSMILIFVVSFCFDALNLFWHALMEPSGHPYRQAPLFVITVITLGCRYLAESAGLAQQADTDRIEVDSEGLRSQIIHTGARYVIALALALGMLFFVSRGQYEYVNPSMLRTNALLLSAFAAALLLLEALLILADRTRARSAGRILAVVLFSLILIANEAEQLENARFIYQNQCVQADTRNGFLSATDARFKAVDAVKAADPDFYRMEQLSPRQQNDSMMFGYNGVTHYSSAGMTYVRYLLQKLGYNDDGLYTHYGHDNTVTMDMLLGIRYILSPDSTLVHPLYEQVLADQTGDMGVYKNPYALSPALKTEAYDLTGITGIDNPHILPQDPFALQEDMLSRLMGHRPVQVFVPADTNDYAPTPAADSLSVQITPAIDGEVYMYLDGLLGSVQGLAVYLEDELLCSYGNRSSYKILNLGYRAAGETFSVRIDGDEGSDFGKPLFMTEDPEALRAVYEELSASQIPVKKSGNAGITLEVGDYTGDIVTSIPYEEGWNIPNIRTYGALMMIPAESVSGNVKDGALHMSFVPKAMRTGGVLSVLTLIAVILWMRRRMRA